MSVKRKSQCPKFFDDAKRKCLSWNSFDYHSKINDPEQCYFIEDTNYDDISLNNSSPSKTPFVKKRSMNNDIQSIINQYEFYLTLNSDKPVYCSYLIGSFNIEILESECGKDKMIFEQLLLNATKSADKSWLYCASDKCLLYFSKISDIMKPILFSTSCSLEFDILSLLKPNEFWLKSHIKDGQISVDIFLLSKAVYEISDSTTPIDFKPFNHSLIYLMNYFYLSPLPDVGKGNLVRKQNIEELFKAASDGDFEKTNKIVPSISHRFLKPSLRQYQKQGVAWMLQRENFNGDKAIFDIDVCKYKEIKLMCGKSGYFNAYNGVLSSILPHLNVLPEGGILADEMGLGKTVELLACLLLHPRPHLPNVNNLPTLDNKEFNLKSRKIRAKIKPMTAYHYSEQNIYPVVQDSIKDPASNDSRIIFDKNSYSFASNNALNVPNSSNNLSNHKIITEVIDCNLANSDEHILNFKYIKNSQVNVKNKISNKSKEQFLTEENTLLNVPILNGVSAKSCQVPRQKYNNFSNSCIEYLNSNISNMNNLDKKITRPMSSNSTNKNSKRIVGNVLDSINLNCAEDYDHKVDVHFDEVNHQITETCDNNANRKIETSLGNQINCNNKNSYGINGYHKSVTDTQNISNRVQDNHLLTFFNDDVKNLISENKNINDYGKMDEKKFHIVDDIELNFNIITSTNNINSNLTNVNESNDLNLSSTLDPNFKNDNFIDQTRFDADIYLNIDGFKNCNVISSTNVNNNYWMNGVEIRKPLECICGEEMDKVTWVVECRKCLCLQHAFCVNYDLTDPLRGEYLCPHCLVSEVPVGSGATLIVAPESIIHQWVEEINKHVDNNSLKIFVYSGVNKSGFIQPRSLAAFDIVLVTYETLRKEINYVNLPHINDKVGRRLRHPKKFMAIPSPLTAIEWWRICLDEAQLVEHITTKTAEMATKLHGVIRWCITGTPIQRDIDDLFGLFSFLGIKPFSHRGCWTRLLYEPYCRGSKKWLIQLVATVLRRTTKKKVLDQIMLPSQFYEIHNLTFSPIEEHFYRRLYEDCSIETMKSLSKWSDNKIKLNSLDKLTLHKLLYPLLKLRQACCHPQVVRGQFLNINKKTLTMRELLDQLLHKVMNECIEAQRQIICACNGLAGYYIIMKENHHAVEEYREVLTMCTQSNEIKIDKLQQIHTLHNLQLILPNISISSGQTLRETQLQQEEKKLCEKYMTRKENFVVKTRDTWFQQLSVVKDIQKQCNKEWYVQLLNMASSTNYENQLLTKIKSDMEEGSEQITLANKFSNIHGLSLIICEKMDQLENSRKILVDHMSLLDGVHPSHLVDEMSTCCLRPVAKNKNKCRFCKAHKFFLNYELNVFSIKDGDPDLNSNMNVNESKFESDEDNNKSDEINEQYRRGNWSDSEVEKTLKSLIAFFQKLHIGKQEIENGLCQIKLLDAYKKEFKVLRVFWQALRERVCCYDEVLMAKSRLRLRDKGDDPNDNSQPNIIDEISLPQQRLKLQTEKLIGQRELVKKKSQLAYLQNLKETHNSFEKDNNPEPCPICQEKLGKRWSVLQCGHCFCMNCIRIITLESGWFRLRCAVCRQTTKEADISFVCTRSDAALDNGDFIHVKGDLSTKIEGVVRVLLEILKKDKEAKCLIFSSWQQVLDLLGDALINNNIEYRVLTSKRSYEQNLNEFKHNTSVPVLLLTVQNGSNGLNLTEAQHVLLVEPILNPGQELQAIGRVHRIGQIRETYVHRFIVKCTIEERMQKLLEHVEVPMQCSNSDETTLTLEDLNQLFNMSQDDCA